MSSEQENSRDSALDGLTGNEGEQQDIDAHTDDPASASVTNWKCAITSSGQIIPMDVAITSDHELACPLCKDTFDVKKSLVRHIKAVKRRFEGTKMACNICRKEFSRPDVLSRHQKSQHSSSNKHVQCQICKRQVRPRSMRQHQASQACQLADGSSAIEVPPDNIERDRRWGEFPESLLLPRARLRAVLDCAILSTRLFAATRPFGLARGSLIWLDGQQMPRSNEIMELQNMVYRAISDTITATDAPTNSALLDAMIIVMMSEVWIGGWEECRPHRAMLLHFASVQIAHCASREAFVDNTQASLFESVLFETERADEARKCAAIVRLALKMMRTSAFDAVSMMGGQPGRPLAPQAVRGALHLISCASQESWRAMYQPWLQSIFNIASTVRDPAPLLQPTGQHAYGSQLTAF